MQNQTMRITQLRGAFKNFLPSSKKDNHAAIILDGGGKFDIASAPYNKAEKWYMQCTVVNLQFGGYRSFIASGENNTNLQYVDRGKARNDDGNRN